MSTPVVLIIGALTGIGRAAALAFARDGHRTAERWRDRLRRAHRAAADRLSPRGAHTVP